MLCDGAATRDKTALSLIQDNYDNFFYLIVSQQAYSNSQTNAYLCDGYALCTKCIYICQLLLLLLCPGSLRMSEQMMGPPKGKTAGHGAAASEYRVGMVASGDHAGAGKVGGEPEADRVTATQGRAEFAPLRPAVGTVSVSHGAAAMEVAATGAGEWEEAEGGCATQREPLRDASDDDGEATQRAPL